MQHTKLLYHVFYNGHHRMDVPRELALAVMSGGRVSRPEATLSRVERTVIYRGPDSIQTPGSFEAVVEVERVRR